MVTRMTNLNLLLCLITPPQVSETFIQDHMDWLKGVCGRVECCWALSKPGRSLRTLVEAFLKGVVGLVHYPSLLRFLVRKRVNRPVFKAWLLALLASASLPRRRYDIIHTHYALMGEAVSILKEAGVLRGRLVVTVHGFDMSTYFRRFGCRGYQFMAKYADAVVCVNRVWLRRLHKCGFNTKHLHIMHPGVDVKSIRWRLPSYDSERPVRILCVGRLVEKKGYDILLRALASFRRPFFLRIVGDGPLRQETERLTYRLGIAEFVEFLGALPRKEVFRQLEWADVFALASRTARDGDMEGLPRALMEAMLAGLVVVTTRHSGIPELVEDSINGFLADEGSVESFKAALERALEASANWGNIALAGRCRVEKQFNMPHQHRRLLLLYHRLLAADDLINSVDQE